MIKFQENARTERQTEGRMEGQTLSATARGPNIDINKIAVSNKVSFGKKGFKHFIGYKDAKKITPLCIFLPKMSPYRRDFDDAKYISFFNKR